MLKNSNWRDTVIAKISEILMKLKELRKIYIFFSFLCKIRELTKASRSKDLSLRLL